MKKPTVKQYISKMVYDIGQYMEVRNLRTEWRDTRDYLMPKIEEARGLLAMASICGLMPNREINILANALYEYEQKLK